MRIVKPSFEIIDTSDPLQITKVMETAGRVCYKSEDKTTETSADPYVLGIIKKGHESVLEHGNIILGLTDVMYKRMLLFSHQDLKYLKLTTGNKNVLSGNARAFRDFLKKNSVHFLLDFLAETFPVLFDGILLDQRESRSVANPMIKLLSGSELTPEEKRVHDTRTVRFIVDTGISHELVRHRVASFSQESSRYCNYSKEKFSNQITFIQPYWISDEQVELAKTMNEHNFHKINDSTKTWYAAMASCESSYNLLTKLTWQAQQARAVLPKMVKTEILMTATLEDWEGIFKLRVDMAAHPQMRGVMIPLYLTMSVALPGVFKHIPLKSRYAEVSSEYSDEENYYIDAWESSRQDAEGKCIALIDKSNLEVTFKDTTAKVDPVALSAIFEILNNPHLNKIKECG